MLRAWPNGLKPSLRSKGIAGNDIASLRFVHQNTLKFPILIIIQVFLNKASKEPSLNEAKH